MNRRSFMAMAGVGLAGSRQTSQDTSQSVGAADPLNYPDLVQRRAVAGQLDNNPVITGVEHRLRCSCPCGLDIFTCRTTDFSCTYSPALHQEVMALFSDGQTADQIVAAFVAKYGEQALMAPRAQGFNIVGYLLPSTLVLLAAGTLGFVLLRRHRNRLLATAPVTSPARDAAALNSDDAARLERALGEIEA